MTRFPALSVCLARPRRPADEPAWPLDLLAAHLESAGHRVETSDSVWTPTMPMPDVVHCFGLTAALDLVSDQPAAPLLVTPCTADMAAGGSASLQPVLASVASAVVTSSSDRAHLHRLGLPWSRTWVLPVAVDVDTFTRLGPMANRTDRFRLVVELSGPDDGVEDVLVAVAKLDEVELVALVGERSTGMGAVEREAALRAAAALAGVSERLAVVTPSSPGERAWWLRSAHVAVAVPHAAGASALVAEAMACGTPVVASPVDALADLVVHGVTGFLVPVADPLSVARAVRMVLQDGFTVESYGVAAADRALSRFAWPRVVHELVGVYRRVASMDRSLEDADEAHDEEDPESALLFDDLSIA